MLVENTFLARRDPGQVEGKRGMLVVERHQLVALENAKGDRRKRLDRVLHLAHDGALEADQIAGQDIVQYLPAPILEHLVAETPTGQDGEKMCAVRTFNKDGRTCI